MISVSIGTSTERKPEKLYEPDTTVKEIIEDQDIIFQAAQVYAEGMLLNAEEIVNTPISDLGATVNETFRIIVIIKTDNA